MGGMPDNDYHEAMEAGFNKKESLSHSNLTTFLYLLMRDEIPTGAVVRLIDEIIKNNRLVGLDDMSVIYTNKHLKAMASEYSERILG
jgi:hypothetical protein